MQLIKEGCDEGLAVPLILELFFQRQDDPLVL